MMEKLDKLAKLELLADQKLASFGPNAENLVDNLNKLKKDARISRDVAFEATRNYTIAMVRLAADQAASAQAALTDVATTASRNIINSRTALANDSRTIREGLEAGTSPSDEELTLPDPSAVPNLDAERGVSALLDGNAALDAANAVSSAGLPDAAFPSGTGPLAGTLAGGLAIPSTDIASALSNAQTALENLQTTLRTNAASLGQVSGSLSATVNMPNVSSIIQSQQNSAGQLQNALADANRPAATAVETVQQNLQNATQTLAANMPGISQAQAALAQTLNPAAQSGALAQTVQQAQQALQNAQITLQSGAGMIASQPGYFLGSQIQGLGAQLANAVQGLQTGNPITAGLSAGITPGLNTVTTPLSGSISSSGTTNGPAGETTPLFTQSFRQCLFGNILCHEQH
jgi:hypothetical protein